MKAADIMHRDVLTIPTGTPAAEVAKILTSHHISGAPVVDDQLRVVGVVSLTDLATHYSDEARMRSRPDYFSNIWIDELTDGLLVEDRGLMVEDIMTEALFRAREGAPVTDLIEFMLIGKIHRLIITDDHQRLTGIVTSTDIMRAFRDRELAATARV